MAKREVSTKEYTAMIARVGKALGHRLADEDSSSAHYVQAVEEAVEQIWRTAIDGWRAAGESDRQIGEALGITGQAVNKRWPRRTPGPPGNEHSLGRV